jgi:hypothetical protein
LDVTPQFWGFLEDLFPAVKVQQAAPLQVNMPAVPGKLPKMWPWQGLMHSDHSHFLQLEDVTSMPYIKYVLLNLKI